MTGQKIRLLHITVGLSVGGAETLMARLVTGLDPDRYDVQVLALKSWGPVGDDFRRHNVPVTILGGRRPWSPLFLARLTVFFLRNDFDIVHSHLLLANLVAAAFKRENRLVWHVHETGEWTPAGLGFLERVFLKRVDQILVVSRAVEKALIARLGRDPGRLTVCPNAIPLPPETDISSKASHKERITPWPSSCPLVGYVGRMDDQMKGVSVLIRAAGRVVKAVPEARFLLVGIGRDLLALEGMVRRAGWESFICFPGEVLLTEDYYRAFDIFVLPSFSEGFGIAILEAMGASLPVVATRVGGIPEIVAEGETGLLVAPGDENALATAMLYLLSNPEKRIAMGQRGRALLEANFSWQRCLERLERVYGEVIRGNS